MNTHTHTHNDSLHLSINHDPNSGAESISFLHVVCGENSASVLALKAAADHIPVKQRPPGKLSPQAKAKFSHSQTLPQWWEQLFSWPTPTSPLNLCTLHWIVKLRGSSSFRAALKTHLFNNFILFHSHAYPCLTCVCVCACACACVCAHVHCQCFCKAPCTPTLCGRETLYKSPLLSSFIIFVRMKETNCLQSQSMSAVLSK